MAKYSETIERLIAELGKLPGIGARTAERLAFHLWTTPLPLVVARMGAVAAWDGLPRFDYEFSISPRGQSYKYFALAKFIERKVYTA